MPEKQQPIGICDLCLGNVPGDRHYTTKGTPRLFCSRDCRNTANSRAGAPVRSEKAKRRVVRGEWQNPAEINPPDPANIGAGVSRVRKAEVKAGTWRNPALTPEARRKLSRPRKHTGVLHRAIEKLKQGAKVVGLTAEEQEAHRRYRRQLRRARREESNAWYRRRYHRIQASLGDEERKEQRAKWRTAWARRKRNEG